MKRSGFEVLITCTVTLLICSCASTSMSVNVDVPVKDAVRVKSVALVMLAFEPVDKPTFPLIDAAFIRSYVNDLGPGIAHATDSRLDEFREKAARVLGDRLQCDVVYGPRLHSSPGFTACRELYDFSSGLATGDESFPVVQLASGDLNFFPVRDGDLAATFAYTQNYGTIVDDLCSKLDVDAIAVVHSRIRVAKPDVVFSRANVMLYTDFYLFGPGGVTILKGDIRSEAAREDPGVLMAYQRAIARFPDNWQTLMKEMDREMK